MNVIKRMKEPTPPFFRQLRNTGLILAAVGSSIVAAPVSLPTVVVKVGGYLAVAGAVASAVSQTVTNEPTKRKKHGNNS